MNTKKKLTFLVIPFLLSTLALTPVYAQENTNKSEGLIGGFFQMFTRMFRPAVPKGQGLGTEDNQIDQKKQWQGASGASGTVSKGQPNREAMEEARLTGLVQAGKITEAQKQAILTELTKIRQEVEAWAKSQGIDPVYIMGGFGPGNGAGMGIGGQKFSGPSGAPRMMLRTNGSTEQQLPPPQQGRPNQY